MSNDIRTRRLIVTLPGVSGEEADTVASFIDEAVSAHLLSGVSAEHALDESPVTGWRVSPVVTSAEQAWPWVRVRHLHGHGSTMSPDEARRLAAHLLRAADEAGASAARIEDADKAPKRQPRPRPRRESQRVAAESVGSDECTDDPCFGHADDDARDL